MHMVSYLNDSCYLQMIKEILNAVTIPVMAKCRIGHFAEAQILESLEVDMVDESEGMSISITALPLFFTIYFLSSSIIRQSTALI